MTAMTLTLDMVGDFVWSFGQNFFVETEVGNFIWSDPDYNGDNTLKKFDGDYKKWCRFEHIPYGRSKGKHVIRRYCGDEVKIIGSAE